MRANIKNLKQIKKINSNFYDLIKMLQNSNFVYTAKLAEYAYEEFLNELSKMLNNVN